MGIYWALIGHILGILKLTSWGCNVNWRAQLVLISLAHNAHNENIALANIPYVIEIENMNGIVGDVKKSALMTNSPE